jgi:hypothetical protein
MWPWDDVTTFNIIEVLPLTGVPAEQVTQNSVFNYFFTLCLIFGILSFGFKILVRIITES